MRQTTCDKIAHKIDRLGDYKPEIVYEDMRACVEIDPARRCEHRYPQHCSTGAVRHRRRRARSARSSPAIPLARGEVARAASDFAKDTCLVARATGRGSGISCRRSSPPRRNIGSLLCDGIGDAILVQGEHGAGPIAALAYNILQAAGTRIFKTDYVACPSCGRTLFNLQTTTAEIKGSHRASQGREDRHHGLHRERPGEMADADFGYVGGAPGKVNLYVGKTPVKFNIPEAEAVDRLQDLIREHGKWVDLVPQPTPVEAVS